MRVGMVAWVVGSACLGACVLEESGGDVGAGEDISSSVSEVLVPDEAWLAHAVHRGPNGADGLDAADVNGDGLLDLTSGWEQAGIVTVSFHPGVAAARQPWPTVVAGIGLSSVEDAQFADVDQDGKLDIICATEGKRIAVLFQNDPKSWKRVFVASATNMQRWMKVAWADMDGDGIKDIVAGGKVYPASIGWFKTPAQPRTGKGYTWTQMSEAGWTMSLVPRDLDGDGDIDVAVSDRTYINRPGGPRRYDLRGSRWLENLGGGQSFAHHAIGFASGEHKFLQVVDLDADGLLDVIDGASAAAYNRTYYRRGLSSAFTSFEVSPIPQPSGVGQYQDAAITDFTLDGVPDLAFSYSHAAQTSGVVGLSYGESIAEPAWQRQEMSGPPGVKFDNLLAFDVDQDGDPDLLSTEQHEDIDKSSSNGPGLGIVWYENPAIE
jgi:FG-GAP-like repeat